MFKTITVTSGKGGSGKTNITANLGVAFAKLGKKVMILDASLGLSNIDIIFGLKTPYSLKHVIKGTKALSEVLVKGPFGITIVPAGSDIWNMHEMDESGMMNLIDQFEDYHEDLDILLIDTAAGISSDIGFFCSASQEIIVIILPEPTALANAAALINILVTHYREKKFRILVNEARDEDDGFEVFKKLSLATGQNMDISLDYLGCIPFDESVPAAVRTQQLFVDAYPDSRASRFIVQLAEKICEEGDGEIKGGAQLFISNLLRSRQSTSL